MDQDRIERHLRTAQTQAARVAHSVGATQTLLQFVSQAPDRDELVVRELASAPDGLAAATDALTALRAELVADDAALARVVDGG